MDETLHALITMGKATHDNQALPDGTDVATSAQTQLDRLAIGLTRISSGTMNRFGRQLHVGLVYRLPVGFGTHLLSRFCRARVGNHFVGRFCRCPPLR
jgi:hypothetical protein